MIHTNDLQVRLLPTLFHVGGPKENIHRKMATLLGIVNVSRIGINPRVEPVT